MLLLEDTTALAQGISAFASLLGSLAIAVVAGWAIMRLGPSIVEAVRKRGEVDVGAFGFTLKVRPSQRIRTSDDREAHLPSVGADEPLPADYLYLVHISFLRDDPVLQKEWQERTGVEDFHYDIRAIVDSYYEGALDEIEYVEYILDESFPEPRHARSQREQKFMLKELANGEFVLIARIWLRNRKEPFVVQRYVTLSSEGPRIEDFLGDR